MPLMRVRLVSQMLSGAAGDRCVWSWGIDAAAPPSEAQLTDGFNAAMLTGGSSATQLRGKITNRVVPEAWEVVPAAGGETLAYYDGVLPTFTAAGATAPQVCLVIQSQIATNRGGANLGRLMLGPLHSAVGTAGRPDQAAMFACTNFAAAWHNALVAMGVTPVVLRNGGTTGTPIVGYSVSNTFGTLRSRRWETTERQSVTI